MLKICLFFTLLVSISVKARIPTLTSSHSLQKLFKDDKIIGGQEVEPNSIPYQLSVQYNGYHNCGGAIYNNRTVITAAHCCFHQELNKMTVVAGEHNLVSDSGLEQILSISTVTIHPDYLPLSNDICLLETKDPFIFNEFVSSVIIAEQGQEFEGDALVSGWGSINSAGYFPDVLMAATVPIVSQEKCKDIYGSDVDNSMICAGKEGKDSCKSDSGGPLTCQGIHCGVVSWGYGCGEAEFPGVYARTSTFSDWIKKNAF